MARRVTHTAAVALAALACGLLGTACGGGASEEQAASDGQAQARWQTGLTRWSDDMIRALNGISVLLAHAASVDRLKSGEPRTSARLARFERTLAGCRAVIARLGSPPNALAAVRQRALRACASLESGARLMRDGVVVWRNGGGIGALDRAYYVLGSGQSGIAHVRADLKVALVSGRASS